MSPNLKLLEAAAAPVLERIRRDYKKAPRQIQPLLAYLETHLFDSDLDANQLKKACGVRDNTVPIKFHQALGLPPYAFIEDCRMEVACRMLCGTEVKIWQIAQLIGYSTLQVFSRAFDRWSGMRPSEYRRDFCPSEQGSMVRLWGPRGSGEAPASPEICEPSVSWSTLRKAAFGILQRDEADALARWLGELYPESFGPVAV